MKKISNSDKKWLKSPAISSCIKNITAVLAAFPVGLLLTCIFSRSQILWLEENILYAMVSYTYKLLCAMAMPLVFFSIIALIVHLRIKSNDENRLNLLFIRYMLSAIVCIGLGVIVYYIFKRFELFPTGFENYQIERKAVIGGSVGEIIENLAPANIIDPFINDSPFPAILTAILLGFALMRMNKKQIQYLNKGILGLKELFTAALKLAYDFLPFMAFICQLCLFIEYLTADDQRIDPLPWRISLAALIPFVFSIVFYAVRLKAAGISVKDFWYENKELLKENFLLASNKDAIDYNLKQLSPRYNLSKDTIFEQLELGGVINMDGDCAVLAVVLLLECIYINRSLTPVDIILMAIIILGVCTGAPNEPGTFLIGASALMKFFGISPLAFSDIVFVEAIVCVLYAFQTSLGDIVTITIFNKKYRLQNEEV